MQTHVHTGRNVLSKIRHVLRFYHRRPLQIPQGRSLLPLVNSCNNLILPPTPCPIQIQCTIGSRIPEGNAVDSEPVVPFLLSRSNTEEPMGYLRSQVASAIEHDHDKHLVSGSASPWSLVYSRQHPRELKFVAFAEWVNQGGKYTRTMHIDRVVNEWKKLGLFLRILEGGSDEAYPVHRHPPKHVTIHDDPIAFAIERAALPLFGLVNFGVLLIAYIHRPCSGQMKLFISRRSATKQTWPGKLDVTVGGSMALGDAALKTITQASAEKALLDQDYVERHARPAGVLSSLHRSADRWAVPGIYYLYDLALTSDVSNMPQKNVLDNEVETIELVDVDTVLEDLLSEQYKPSAVLAIIDFLIRHGYLTEESDPRYLEICRVLKRDIDLPLAWRAYNSN